MIKITRHLRHRLRVRKIPKEYPKMIYRSPEMRFYDMVEEKSIAIKKLDYNGKLRNMMIAYEEKGEDIEIVTIHPVSEKQISNRIERGRWK